MKASYDHDAKIYTGIVNRSVLMEPAPRSAITIYYGQRARADVSYSCREFVYWYVHHPLREQMKSPEVIRLDMDRPFSFDNIEMIESGRNRRFVPNEGPKKVIAFDADTGQIINRFDTIDAAAKFYQVNRATVRRHCDRTEQTFRSKVQFQWDKNESTQVNRNKSDQ